MCVAGSVPEHPSTPREVWPANATSLDVITWAQTRSAFHLAKFGLADHSHNAEEMDEAVRGMRNISTRMAQFTRGKIKLWTAEQSTATKREDTRK